MPVDSIIRDSQTGDPACVTKSGQLVVAPVSYDESVFKSMAVDDQVYNFFVAKIGQRFVVTGIALRAGFGVANNADADVVIYEALAVGASTVTKVIHQEPMTRFSFSPLFPLNLLVTEGRWINGKTSDATVGVTVFGYYIDAVAS